MRLMRAKLRVLSVEKRLGSETVKMTAVGPKEAYPEDGSDENNDYARWSPMANFEIEIANPELHGKIADGDEFYVDFTKANG